MSQLGRGDRTAQQLQQISDLLTHIDGKLVVLQDTVNDIKRRVDANDFTNMMIAFDVVRVKVDSINRNGMQEVRRAAENLAQVMSAPHTPEQIAEAEACLQTKREAYEDLLATNNGDLNQNLITSLMSATAGKGTLVNGYGRLLLTTRFLSDVQSDALRDFYDYLEQYQALAAIQRAEWQISKGISRTEIVSENTKFFNEIGIDFKPAGTIQTQRSLLPDPIPEGVRIDLGAAAADTTVGKTMLLVMGGVSGPDLVTYHSPDGQGWTGPAEAVKVATDFVGPGVAALKGWGAGRVSRCWPHHVGIHVDRSGSMAVSGRAAEWLPTHPDIPRERSPVSTQPELDALRRFVAAAFANTRGRLIVSRVADTNYVGLKAPRPPSP